MSSRDDKKNMRALLRSGAGCALAAALTLAATPVIAPAQTTVQLPDVAGGRALPLPLPTPVDETVDRVTTPLNDTVNGITAPLTGQTPPASTPSTPPPSSSPSTPQSSTPADSPAASTASPGNSAGAAPSQGSTPGASSPNRAAPSNGGGQAPSSRAPARGTTRSDQGRAGSTPSGSPRSGAPARAAAAAAAGPARDDAAAPGATGADDERSRSGGPGPLRTVVEKAPTALIVAVIALALLGLAMAASSARNALSARRLRRQRGELQRDVGALQDALLPPVLDNAFGVAVGVKSIPAEGPAAGGDFHDVVSLPGRRLGIVVGDISGHGREALGSTALAHYTVRAYLEAGLSPREAIRLAGQTLDEKLGTDFATVACAIYDPDASRLDYAVAGHPAPIVTGAESDQALTQLTPPPIGMGLPTGFRQTSVPLSGDQGVCFFSDGVVEAHQRDHDALLGRDGLIELLREHAVRSDPDALVAALHERTTTTDDVTALLLAPEAPMGNGPIVEEIDVDPSLAGSSFDAFCRACGLSDDQLADIQFTLGARGGSAQLRIERTPGGADWSVADPGEVALAAALSS